MFWCFFFFFLSLFVRDKYSCRGSVGCPVPTPAKCSWIENHIVYTSDLISSEDCRLLVYTEPCEISKVMFFFFCNGMHVLMQMWSRCTAVQCLWRFRGRKILMATFISFKFMLVMFINALLKCKTKI